MAARPIDGAEGYGLFLRHDGDLELDEINEYLRGINMREVQPRMLQHYKKLQRHGYDSYITQNRLDLAVAGEHAWTEDMRAQYPELRQHVAAEFDHLGRVTAATVERIGTASASVLVTAPPPAGSTVVLRLLATGIERLGTVTRTDHESGRFHVVFDTYSSLPVAADDAPYKARIVFDLPDTAESVVAISDLLLRLERALTRLDRRGSEVTRISSMRMESPLEIQLTGNELIDTFLKVATALVALRHVWYQSTKVKYEGAGVALDNAQKRRAAQKEADAALMQAMESEENAETTPLLDQVRTSEFDKGEPGSMTRRQLIEAVRATIALPIEMTLARLASKSEPPQPPAH